MYPTQHGHNMSIMTKLRTSATYLIIICCVHVGVRHGTCAYSSFLAKKTIIIMHFYYVEYVPLI